MSHNDRILSNQLQIIVGMVVAVCCPSDREIKAAIISDRIANSGCKRSRQQQRVNNDKATSET